MTDPSFTPDQRGLLQALNALVGPLPTLADPNFPHKLPEHGLGESQTLDLLAPIVIGGAQHLGTDTAFAHMDPPTPWITWATTLWNAALNQNLLHPDVAPATRDIEKQVIDWLSPCFSMSGGHMTPGSTIANLTALWAARELKNIKTVVASEAAHLSVAKAAHILGLEYLSIGTNKWGQLNVKSLPKDLSTSALVLTAGTTSAGAIDQLSAYENCAWTHVDAAWAGPLRLSTNHANKLNGIESADSIAISAHKWLYQPKESGLVLFKDADSAHKAVSFGAAYLAVPNVGVLGSHGANALPLLATLIAWGRTGLQQRIDAAMLNADRLFSYLDMRADVQVYSRNISGVLLWHNKDGNSTRGIIDRLPKGSASLTTIDGSSWIRHVAANPNVDITFLTKHIDDALRNHTNSQYD